MLGAALSKQLSSDNFIPKYNYHVTDSIVSMEDGRLLFVARFKGVPFEVISDNVLENNYDSLNSLILSVAKSTGSRLSLWAHIDHFKTQFKADYEFEFEWMKQFGDEYMKKFTRTDLFENNFYMTFILAPGANDSLDDTIKELNEIILSIKQSLGMYECEILKEYTHEGNLFSEIYELFSYLHNGFWEKIPVTSLPLASVIPSSKLHWHYKILENRHPDGGVQFSSFYDLKDFPDPTSRGRFNAVLDMNFPFVVAMSFNFIESAASVKMINSALNKMISAGDEADTQMEEMSAGKGAVMSGLVYFGEFHCALMVHGETMKKAEDNGASARTTFSGYCATLFSPASGSAPSTFYSMLPGAMKHRPRPMPKTTRNLLSLFSMNNFSSGKQYGNPIGDGSAVMPLRTTANGVYHFNAHYSMPGVDAVGEKMAGHILMLGATGVGKTTTQTTILTFVTRFNANVFGIDKDGSMRGFIEASGGTYFSLKSGEPTGLNPFQFPDTPFTRNFLYDLVAACGRRNGQEMSAEDVKDIKRAVDNVFELPFENRRFGVVLQSMPDNGEDCLARRLADWAYGEVNGRYAYALDNEKNEFDWEGFRRVGFDVTDFLVAGHAATEPILSVLLHIKSLMQRRGGLLATVVEEFWLSLKYPTTANQILDVLKTGRRRDEFIVLVSQSPEDAIDSPLFPTILQQTPTKIFLPNPDAEYETPSGGGYSRCGLSVKEFEKLKKLGSQSRSMLIKQGSQAAITKLDLSGMGDDIAVLAMAAEDFYYLEAAKREVGDHPDAWVPLYKKLRAADRKLGKRGVK